MRPSVSATIVTYNADRYIARCLEALRSQSYPISEIVVVDNSSTDSTREIVAQFPHVKLLCRSDNSGYCVAQNQAISAATADWVLCINPDTTLRPDCIENLVRAGELHPAIGIVCPKILRMNAEGRIL
ncbi:MAG TPA: glycosyltransferase, partial [Terriglobales bacterium]